MQRRHRLFGVYSPGATPAASPRSCGASALSQLRGERAVRRVAAPPARLSDLRPADRADRRGLLPRCLLVNLVIAEVLPPAAVVVVLLRTWPHPPWNLLLSGGAALAAISPFVFCPFSKLIWLAVDLSIQPARKGRDLRSTGNDITLYATISYEEIAVQHGIILSHHRVDPDSQPHDSN